VTVNSQRRLYLASIISCASLTLIGCGSQSSIEACSAGQLTTTQTGAPNFTLVVADFAIYPGQTEQIPVQIQSVGGAQGNVTLNGLYLPQGVSVSSVSANIGSTAMLTVTAANNVVAQCFQASQSITGAGRAITIEATSGNARLTTQVAMEVVLENPSFVPAATNLPVMSINTVDAAPITSEDDYVDATLSIVDTAHPSNNYTGTTEIKGHGNSTWIMPKKPYRLNLDSKAPLLGMTSDSNWILLANYDDKTMLRNDVSFKISQMFGMAWTPSTEFVEVYINGVYNGTYELSEKVEVSKARLNIGSIDDTDNSGNDLTGGYIGEIDHYNGETFMMTSLVGLPIGIDDPDPPTTEQSTYFSTNFKLAENSMYNTNFKDPTTGWQAYWDEASLVNWFLVEELAGNQDADDWSSDYFYKPRSDPKFYRGPVWDMDITFGNDNGYPIASPNAPWVSVNSQWYAQLFKDPAFTAAVKAQWAVVRPQVLTLPAYIDTRAAALNLAQQNNFARWPILGEIVWPNTEAAGTYTGEVEFMKTWLNSRIAYMDSQYLQ
jgi:CotH kinase protein